MTSRKKREAEQQTVVHDAWTQQTQSGAHIALEMRSMSSGRLTAWLVPLSETEEGKKRLQEYYEALGRFTDIFSQVETAIATTLWFYANTTKDIAKIIFAGARIEVSSSYIKQLAKVTGTKTELQHYLEYILQQLGIINGARNDIVNFGATSIVEGRGIVSNALKTKEEPRVFQISTTLLDKMTADLRKVIFHLRYRHYDASLDHGEADEILQTPWRYKHPLPPKSRSKKAEDQLDPKHGSKRPRQPRS
jgi:hypothetical protein